MSELKTALKILKIIDEELSQSFQNPALVRLKVLIFRAFKKINLQKKYGEISKIPQK